MTIASYVFSIAAALAILVVVIELLRRRLLRERHAVWWLLAGVLALLAGLFPSSVVWLAGVVGITLPTNLVFFISIGILFLVSLQQSAELTRQEARIRRLAEVVTLQDIRLRRLEEADQARATGPADGPES